MSFQHVDEMTVAGMVYRIETQSSDGEQVRIAMTAYRESDPDRTPIHGILHVPLAEVPVLRLVVGRCLQALMSAPELTGNARTRAGSVVAAVADSASALVHGLPEGTEADTVLASDALAGEVLAGEVLAETLVAQAGPPSEGASELADETPFGGSGRGPSAADSVPRARAEARPSAPGRPPRGTPPRARLPWRPEQEQELVRRFDRGEAIASIAAAVGRTEGAVRSRLRLLGRDVERAAPDRA